MWLHPPASAAFTPDVFSRSRKRGLVRSLFLSAALLMAPAYPAGAALLGEIRDVNGKHFRGEIRLEQGVFVVVDEAEVVTRIKPGELKYLQCRSVSDATLEAERGGGNGLTGFYFEGRDFSGAGIRRVDPEVDFSWGDRAPISGLKKDQFSVRWTGEILAPDSGAYTLYLTTDDGGRLWLGDRLLVDQWRDQSAHEGAGEVTLEKGQRYPLKIEYYESASEAVVKLAWRVPNGDKTIVPSGHLFPAEFGLGAGSTPGLVGRYFKGSELTGTPHIRVDQEVNFDWGEAPPMRGFDNDHFSVRWTGAVEAPSTGKYVFYIVTNDGGRLWVDDRLLIDQWRGQAATEGRGEMELVAGRLYSLRFEHFQNSGTAVAKLLWEGPAVGKEVIPNGRLQTGLEPEEPLVEEGLLGSYFRGIDLNGSPKFRIDSSIDFNWKDGRPLSGLGTDEFSVRWEGRLKVQKTDEYRFHIEGDDGVRLWVDHDLLIDEWHAPAGRTFSRPVGLTGGEEYDLRLEYYELQGGAMVQLGWSAPGMGHAVIPSRVLIPASEAEARRTMMMARKGLPEGVVLSDGTLIARRVHSADDTVVTFSSSSREPRLSTPSVAWVVFQSLPPDMADGLASGRQGVMLRNGDFIDGEFKGMEGNRIRISSVLFGIRTFDRGQVRAVVLRPVLEPSARFEVRSKDGSVFLVDTFEIDADGLGFQSPMLGGIRIAAGDLLEVRRASAN